MPEFIYHGPDGSTLETKSPFPLKTLDQAKIWAPEGATSVEIYDCKLHETRQLTHQQALTMVTAQ